MVHILPGRPTGKPDQMSPIRAADPTEFIPTGKLELVIEGRYASYGGKHIKDTTKIKLEDRLPELFAALDKYELEAIYSEEQQQKTERERERLRQLAIERATAKYYEQVRWQHFTEQVRLQDETVKQRAFIDEARRVIGELDTSERQPIEKHLEAMSQRVDEQDPLATPSLLLPEIPEPSDKDLEQFLAPHFRFGPGF